MKSVQNMNGCFGCWVAKSRPSNCLFSTRPASRPGNFPSWAQDKVNTLECSQHVIIAVSDISPLTHQKSIRRFLSTQLNSEEYFYKHFVENASSKTFKLNFDMWTLKLRYNLKFKWKLNCSNQKENGKCY